MLSLFDVVDARENDDVRDGPGIPTKESSTLGGIEWNGMKLKLNHTDCLISLTICNSFVIIYLIS